MTDGLDISDIETRAGVSSVTDVDRVVPGIPIASGQTLGRYVVLEQIGRGGIGRVLRAYDSKLEREVALKLLDRSALEERTQARIVHEARTMAKLSHPNVVSVYDVEDTALGVVLVMEYVRGRTLRSWIRDETPGWERIVERFCEAGRGLAAAHASEILHLDFKPSNVLIPQTGHAKVADFGIARFIPGLGSDGSSMGSGDPPPVDEGMTRQGAVIGTPRYMAPEQHRNEDLHPATDQYGFCVALWEALVGAPPFSAPVARLGTIKREGPPPWPESLVIPRPIVAAIVRGLAPEPSDRWPTMKALLDVLADDPRRRRRAWLTVAGGIGLIGLGGVASRTWSPPAPEVCTGAPALLEEVWSDPRRDESRPRALAGKPRRFPASAGQARGGQGPVPGVAVGDGGGRGCRAPQHQPHSREPGPRAAGSRAARGRSDPRRAGLRVHAAGRHRPHRQGDGHLHPRSCAVGQRARPAACRRAGAGGSRQRRGWHASAGRGGRRLAARALGRPAEFSLTPRDPGP